MTKLASLRNLKIGGRNSLSILRVLLFCALAMLALQTAQGQTFSVIHSFTGGGDGYQPFSGLTLDQGGNLYGTTTQWVQGQELPANLPRVERILPCTPDQRVCESCGKETCGDRLRRENQTSGQGI
jgi:hypothetical protein